MKTDAELLQQFVSRHAEEAFTELVNRHIGVVYSAACRETQGDLSAAQDVTQLVFIELVRKAASLQRHPTLAGWLYTCVRYISANQRRSAHRRTVREQEARVMNELLQTNQDDPTWQEVRPVLDDAMHELDERDKDAVLLRFFQGKSLREVGEALCLTENAARMRVDRALEKLRRALSRRGVNSTGAALASALAAGMIAAPPALTAAVTASALATATVSATSTATLFGVAMTKPAMVGLGALALAAVSVPLWQQMRYERLAQHNKDLRQQLEATAQLNEENLQLVEALRAADERAQEEHLELLRLRRKSAAARTLAAEKEKDVPELEDWRQRFEAAYKLRDNEVLRRISPPFIRERAEYFRREWGSVVQERNLGGIGYLVFLQDEQGLRERSRGFFIGKNDARLETVLNALLHLKRYEFHGADELLALAVPGDWVIRKGVSVEAQLAALEGILREATGRNVCFERQAVSNDVVVVRGSSAPGKELAIDVFAEKRDYIGGICRGTFQRFLEDLGERLNVPVASEVRLQNPSSLCCWVRHPDSDCSRAGDRRGELVYKVLDNLSRQTSLTFELQRRPDQVWWIKEQL